MNISEQQELIDMIYDRPKDEVVKKINVLYTRIETLEAEIENLKQTIYNSTLRRKDSPYDR